MGRPKTWQEIEQRLMYLETKRVESLNNNDKSLALAIKCKRWIRENK